jgi:hypothetical protein
MYAVEIRRYSYHKRFLTFCSALYCYDTHLNSEVIRYRHINFYSKSEEL